MTSIADAYVDLHVNGDNIEGEVRSEVKDTERSVSRDFDKAGRSLGEHMAGGFLKGFGKKDRSFIKTGKRIGSRFVSGFETALGKVKGGVSKVKAEIEQAFKGFSLKGLMLPAIAAVVPLITSGLSALTGAVTAFTGATAQAVPAVASFAGVLGSLIQAKLVGKLAFAGFTDAVGGDKDALKALSPEARKAALATKALTGEWKTLKTAVQDSVFKGLSTTITAVGQKDLPVLQRGLVGTGSVLNGLFQHLGKFAQSESFVKRFDTALKGNNKTLATLAKAATPLLRGLLNTFIALQPSAQRLAKVILNVARSFNAWSNAPGRGDAIDKMMRRAFKTAGVLWHILKNLGSTLRNVFGAATPSGKGLLKTFEGLTSRLRKFTELTSTKSSIATWAKEGIQVSGTLFKGLGKGFKMISGLFDPKILGGFMKIFQQLWPTIMAVVKVLQGALEPIIKRIGDAFAKNGPKFAALFTALAPLLKGIGAVLGELIGQTLDTLGMVAALITPVVRIISKVLGPVLVKLAPIIAFLILAFVNWESVLGKFILKLVKFIPYIGKFMAPLIKLAAWIFDLVGPAFKLLGRIGEAVFKGLSKVIGGSTKGIFTVVRLYFTALFKVIGFVMKGVWALVKVIWRGISAIFERYAPAIKVVVEVAFSAIKRIVSTYIGAVRTVVMTAWNVIRGGTRVAWAAIKTFIVNPISAAVNIVKKGLNKVVDFFKKIPNKVLGLAATFLNAGTSLGNSIISGLWAGLKAAGGLVGDLASSIKSAINDALHLPVHIHGPGPLPDFDIPAFANGTRSAPGGLALVGERGPELVNLPRGTRVQTARETRKVIEDNRTMGPEQAVYIGQMMPHNYNEFSRQMTAERRLSGLGSRRPAA